jgi:histidinol-phosphate aminotransferase
MVEALNHENRILAHVPQYVREMLPYRPGKPIDELKEEYGFENVIKLASNENPFGASPKALEAVQNTLTETFRYPDPVSRRLRRKIAATLGAQPEELVIAAGSENLLATTIRTMMRPGDYALTGAGAFMGLEIHLAAHGGKIIKVPSPAYRFDIDALIEAVTPDIRVLYLPNPNNPTGSYFTHQELQKILNNIPRTTLLLLDEAYIEFCADVSDYPKSLTLRQENLLILRTFSKAFGLAGFRIGYGIGHPDLIEHLSKVKMTFEPSLPAQYAAEAAWEDTAFIEKTVKNNRQEMQRYYAVFEQLGLSYVPSHGNFVMAELASPDHVNAVNEALLRRGIAIRPLASFGFPSCLRITVGLPAENEMLFQALREILPTLSGRT